MDVGYGIIGIVITNKKGLCKDTIDNMTKNWPCGSYPVLKRKSIVIGDKPLIATDYRYSIGTLLGCSVCLDTVM